MGSCEMPLVPDLEDPIELLGRIRRSLIALVHNRRRLGLWLGPGILPFHRIHEPDNPSSAAPSFHDASGDHPLVRL